MCPLERKLTLALVLALAVAEIFGCGQRDLPVAAGGLTFDFEAISAKRFATSGGRMLDPTCWKTGYCYMHCKDVAPDDVRRTEVKRTVEYRTDADGVAAIVKKPELVKVCRS